MMFRFSVCVFLGEKFSGAGKTKDKSYITLEIYPQTKWSSSTLFACFKQ